MSRNTNISDSYFTLGASADLDLLSCTKVDAVDGLA
jgi:hypothetical protein